ncbi:helix-turn-helix domain-containing protein [Streptomyces bambusae]|uniref:helix-turn-helix domain-containing protein n=1 Tax=Streptomyces bambusae TaxID=1550616 RepID=UPI001CFE4241|nr:helix-turn-helix domain-containing protein [Streptomyces bambusae]MCB5166026.1 helix-turn-helix domain-containing protein [Streptomyces bambusae]
MIWHEASAADGDADALTVLALLAQEAPREHFDELLRTARSSPSATPRQLAALERAVELGLTVHASADQRRRRESGMAALVDTARDMTSPYDLDGLFSVITGRARRLLGFDMAYISLRKPEGGSYVHSSDGETTMFNVGLQIDVGHGLGETAQDKRAPFWTADYLNDTAFAHSPRIDEVVRAEGLHAILAVPLCHGSSPVGALYGADRKLRHFTPDEVSLMRSLADLAAVALEKARLMEGTKTELAQLSVRSTRERAVLDRTRALAAGRDRLAGMLLDGADLAEVAAATGEMLDGTVHVHDASGRPIGRGPAGTPVPEETVARGTLAALAARGPVALGDTLWATPVGTGTEELGVLLFEARTPLGPEEAAFLGHAGRSAALVLRLQRGAAVTGGPVRDEIFEDLLVGTTRAPRRLAERARRLGIDTARPHSVVVVRPEASEQGRATAWASLYAHRSSGLKTVHGGCVVLLLPDPDPSAAAAAVHRELSGLLGQPVSVASAGPARVLSEIKEVYEEAQRSLEALIALGGTGTAAATGDLGFLGMLLSDDLDVDRYIDSTFGTVIEYDEQRDAELVRTLEAYFASQASPTRAAGILHVHPNTVSRRLERLTELLGADWQEPSRALEIQLALRLLHTRELLRHRHGGSHRRVPRQTPRGQADSADG